MTKFRSKDYLDRWMNPPEVLEAEAKKYARADGRRCAMSLPPGQPATSCNTCSTTPGSKIGKPTAFRLFARKATTMPRKA